MKDEACKYLPVAPTPAAQGEAPSPEGVAALKLLAQMGAGKGWVATSSGALGNGMGLSQQTASRKILELLDLGLLERRMGARGQQLRLTRKGLALLRREFEELRAILQEPAEGGETWLEMHGKVATGLGEGGWYMAKQGYRDPLHRLLGFAPFPGTLNLALDAEEVGKLEELRAREGMHVPEFMDEGRSFGAVKCFRAKLQGVEAGVVLPYRGHHKAALEVVAPLKLREKLGLSDGDVVDIQVALGA